MTSRLDAEFVAVPRTNDVAFGFVILLRPRGLVARDRLEHALHDAALADRTGAMRASVMPGVEFAADLEDADFRISAHHHLAIAVGIVVDVASHILGHPASSRFSFAAARAETPVAPFTSGGLCDRLISIGIRVRSSTTPDRTANTIFGWSDTRRVSRAEQRRRLFARHRNRCPPKPSGPRGVRHARPQQSALCVSGDGAGLR